jgi:hypothetical protein
VKTQIVISSADYVEQLIDQNYRLFNSLVPFDGRNNLHVTIRNFVMQKEAAMLKLPPEQQRNQAGLPFKSAKDYWALPEAKRKDFWTFTQKDVEVLLVNGVLKNARNQIKIEDEKFAKRAKARGINLESSVGGQPPVPMRPAANGHVTKAAEDEDDDKPNTPEAQVPSRAAGGGAAPADDPRSRFQKKFLGKE